MPVSVPEATLAASPGHDVKRAHARHSVALAFFEEHIFEADPEDQQNWDVVRFALQCIDGSRPVTFGPLPSAPRRLVALPAKSPIGKGFFTEQAAKDARAVEWFTVSSDALYMKYYVLSASVDAVADATATVRYFIPGARNPGAKRVVDRERG